MAQPSSGKTVVSRSWQQTGLLNKTLHWGKWESEDQELVQGHKVHSKDVTYRAEGNTGKMLRVYGWGSQHQVLLVRCPRGKHAKPPLPMSLE